MTSFDRTPPNGSYPAPEKIKKPERLLLQPDVQVTLIHSRKSLPLLRASLKQSGHEKKEAIK